MIGLKNSYEIAYNGTENECRFELYADTAAEMVGVTHYDGIKIQMGSEFTDISTGDRYLLNGSGVWVLQPSANAWENVYTKAEIDSMITEIYGIIAYYHTTLVSDTGEITFYSLGGNAGTWAIYGNGQQTGTTTPEFVGARTGNLWDLQSWTNTTTDTKSYFQLSITLYNGSTSFGERRFDVHETGRVSLTSVTAGADGATRLSIKHNGSTRDIAIGNVYDDFPANQPLTISFDVSGYDPTIAGGISISNIMLNLGSTALPYEPYGWKIPITCGGETNNVYLSAPLRKAIDGTDAVDTLQSTGNLTRNVDENGDALVTPTTETITVPDIPTVQGENTLTVDTDLKPSKIEISGER